MSSVLKPPVRRPLCIRLTSIDSMTGSKLSLDDLLAPLASQSQALLSLKNSTKALNSTSSKAKTLSAPLPQRTQERLDREAAYEQTKEEVDKWSGTMKRIREVGQDVWFSLYSLSLTVRPTGRTSEFPSTSSTNGESFES